MTQNIYDTPEFFEGYSNLPRSIGGLDAANEWPALRALLPEIKGLRILDLGCGFGWFCRFAAEQGVTSVLGLDVSQNMLARARSSTTNPAITYQLADLERPQFPASSFDLVYSSLALHYIQDLDGLLAQVRRALVPGGLFVFSIEHPIYMAPTNPDWVTDSTGHKTWPLDNYLVEGPRSTNWLADGVLKYHRTIGTTLNLLIRNGFAISHVEEWQPTPEQIAACPELVEELHRPMFLLIAAEG